MYRIIGADGKEYGPISVEQLRQWVAEGRANAQTKVLAEGASDWKTLGGFPEFASASPIAPPPPAFRHSVVPAADQVNGPAIGLMVTAILGFLASLSGMAWNLFATGAGVTSPNVPPEMQQFIHMFSGALGVVGGFFGLVVAGLILYGALKMKKLEGHTWAMTASILALVPCVSPCCLLGLPVGIWALIVLSKPEVKSAFH